MGKSYSVEKKSEEVIIAQNGANSATTSQLEQNLEKYGTIAIVIVLLCGIYLVFVLYKKCKQDTRKILQKDMAVWHSTMSLQVAPQQAQPRHHVV